MKYEKWVDATGTVVHETGRRCSATTLFLTKDELRYAKTLIRGSITKFGKDRLVKTFFAPLQKVH